jgi:RNA polymerase sigma-70 factor (ECF subfamily)
MASFPSTSLSLLARAQARHEDAWRRLVALYGPLVYHWCRRGRLAPEDTADVFQEVFHAVARHLPEFRRDRPGASFRGWLRVITRNKVRDHFRDRAGAPAPVGGSDAQRFLSELPGPLPEDDEAEADLLARQLRQALAWTEGDFEERTWRAFCLVRLEGRDPAEVGAELGLSAAAVRKACYRVQKRLRDELEGLVS